MINTRSEAKIIKNFSDQKENTMNAIVSASVGIVLLRLKRKYLGEKSTDDQINLLYDACIKEMETTIPLIAAYQVKSLPEERQEEEFKIAKEAMLNALTFIINKVNEPVSQLDTFTIFYPSQSTEKYIVPLKEVLILVWSALNDNEQYINHYTYNKDKPDDRLVKAKEDRIARLFSFYERIKGLMNNPVCHHGTRNEMVFTLNRIYPDVDMIEDARFAICAYLKQEISKDFLIAYKKSDLLNQKKLMSALIIWMNDHNPEELINKIDSHFKKQLQNGLSGLFICHGSNPEDKGIRHLIDETFTFLEFSSDSQPLLLINYLLNESEDKSQPKRNAALGIIQKFIRNDYQFNNQDDCFIIQFFSEFYQIHKKIMQYELLIKLAGELSDEMNHFINTCDNYFTAIINGEEFITAPDVSHNISTSISVYHKVIEKIKNDKMVVPIRDFFAQWFDAENSGDKKAKHLLYVTILLNSSLYEKILWTDVEIKHFIENRHSISEIEFGPYEINRIFLHAIIKKPTEWSSSFFEIFSKVLEFVKNDFNHQQNNAAITLKRDSYPKTLIIQLEYLENCYKEAILGIQTIQPNYRPDNLILLPEHIKNAEEWAQLSEFLKPDKDEKQLILAYGRNSVYINHLLAEKFRTVNYSSTKTAIIESIPSIYQVAFICNIVKNITQLRDILRNFSSKYRFSIIIIQTLSCDEKIKNMIENTEELGIFLEMMTNAHVNHLSFLHFFRQEIQKIITNGDKINHILQILSDHNRVHLINILQDHLSSIIQTDYQLIRMFQNTPKSYHMKIVDCLNEKIKNLIQNKSNLWHICFERLSSKT